MKSVLSLSLLILLAAALLRFANLNSIPVFADESIYIRWAQIMKAESTMRFLPLSDGKQPLFMWLVIPFLKIFSDPLLAGRMVSGLAGIGTVAGVGAAAWLIFKNLRTALVASMLWAVLPYAVFFDRLALSDSLMTMFVVWAPTTYRGQAAIPRCAGGGRKRHPIRRRNIHRENGQSG